MIAGSKVIDFEKANRRGIQMLQHGDKFGFLIICGVNFGLRITDLLGVSYDQLKSGEFVVGEKKTGKKRKIVVNDNVKEGLKYMEDLDPVNYELGGSPFKSQKATIMSPQQVNRRMKRVFGAGYSSHGMRKSFGRRLYEKKEKNLSIVQLVLQHNNPADTLRYIGITQEDMDNSYADIL